MDIKRILKLTAGAAFHVVSRAALFTALGVLVNLAYLALLIPEMSALADSGGAMPAARAGGAGALIALLALVVVHWPITLIVLTFGAAFPALHFALGQKHGVRLAIVHILREQKSFLVVYVIDRLFAHIRSRPDLVARVNQCGLRQTLNEVLPGYLRTFDNLPWVMRKLFRVIVGKLDVAGILMKIVDDAHIQELDPDRAAAAAAAMASQMIDEKLLTAPLTWFWILGGLNFALFLTLKIAV